MSKLGANSVTGNLKYFWGFSGDSMNPCNNHPKDIATLRAQKS